MGKVYTTSEDLTSVANAIRAKTGSEGSLVYPSGFVSAIGSISGGAPVKENDVNFYDYDGTIVYSYTAAEFALLLAFPDNPSHSGLTALGWNWDLADAKSFVASYGKLDIGLMYVTASGATEIDITLNDPDYLSPYLYLDVRGTVEVDWGDNSSTNTITGASPSITQFLQHIYSQIGKYTIKLKVLEGTITIANKDTDTDGLLRAVDNTENNKRNRNHIYSSTITFIRLGNNTILDTRSLTNCSNMKYITLPANLTTISSHVFRYCYSLKCIIVPKDITTIGTYAFAYCYNLTSIITSLSITQLGSYVCYLCRSLSHFIIPDKITEILSNSFAYCNAIKFIIIPSTITTIGSSFSDCYSLNSITIPSTLTTISGSFMSNCANITNITLPSNLTSITNYAFQYCYRLRDLEIPSTVTSIGQYAFTDCYSLSTLTIPAAVTSIGNYAFMDNYGTREYHFLSTTPPTLGTTAFYNIVTGTIIYVPYSSDHSILNAYKTATNWSSWADYILEEPAP